MPLQTQRKALQYENKGVEKDGEHLLSCSEAAISYEYCNFTEMIIFKTEH